MKKIIILLLIVLLVINNIYFYKKSKEYESYYMSIYSKTISTYYYTFKSLNFLINNTYKTLSYKNLRAIQDYMERFSIISDVGVYKNYYFGTIHLYLVGAFNDLEKSYRENREFTNKDIEYYNNIKESITLIAKALEETFYLKETGRYNFTSYNTSHLDEIMPKIREKLSRR